VIQPPATTAQSTSTSTTGNASTAATSGGLSTAQFNDDGTVKTVIGVDYDADRRYKPYDGDLSEQENRTRLTNAVKKLGGDANEADDMWSHFKAWPGERANPGDGALNSGEHGYMLLSSAQATIAKSQNLTPYEYAVSTGLTDLHKRYDDDAKQKAADKAAADAAVTKPVAPLPPLPSPHPLPPLPVKTNMNTALVVVGAGLAIYLISELS
jgi:hypothetical protein